MVKFKICETKESCSGYRIYRIIRDNTGRIWDPLILSFMGYSKKESIKGLREILRKKTGEKTIYLEIVQMDFTYIFERDEVLKGKQPDFPNQLPLGAVVETKMGWKAIRFINDKIEIKTRFKFKWDAIKWVREEWE